MKKNYHYETTEAHVGGGHGIPSETIKIKKRVYDEPKEESNQMYKQCECEELFAFAKTKEGIVILCGKFKISSKTFNTYNEAEEYVKSKPYEILINVSVLMVKLQLEQEKETKTKGEEQ